MAVPRNRSTRAFSQIEEPSLLRHVTTLPPPASPSPSPLIASAAAAAGGSESTSTPPPSYGTNSSIIKAKTVEIRRLVSPTRSPTRSPASSPAKTPPASARSPPVTPPPRTAPSSSTSSLSASANTTTAAAPTSGKPPVFGRSSSPEKVARGRSHTRDNAASAGSISSAAAQPLQVQQRRRDMSEWRDAANRLSQRVLELEAENRLLKSSSSRPLSLSLVEPPPRTFAGGEMHALLHAAKAAEAEDADVDAAAAARYDTTRPPPASLDSSAWRQQQQQRSSISKSKSYGAFTGNGGGRTVAEAVAASHRARSTRKSTRAAAPKPVEQLRNGYWDAANNVKSSFSCNNLQDVERRDLALESLAQNDATTNGHASRVTSRQSTGSATAMPHTTEGMALQPPPLARPAPLEKSNSTNTRGATRGHRDATALMHAYAQQRHESLSVSSSSFPDAQTTHRSSTPSTATGGTNAQTLDNDFGATHRQQRAIASSFRHPDALLRRASSSFGAIVDATVEYDEDEDDDSDAGDRATHSQRRSVPLTRKSASNVRVTSPRSLQEAGLRATGALMAPPPSRRVAAAAAVATASPNSKRHAATTAATAAVSAPTKRPSSSSDVRLWVGTWNMGAADPFADGNGIIDEQRSGAMLQHLLPHGYQLYVLGVQEGVSENVYHAVEAYLNRNVHGTRYYRLELRNSAFQLANKHHPTDAVIDAVHGRGDGAFVGTKFTGLAVFVAATVQDKVQLVRAGVHKFSVTSGSKGGVAVALRIHHTTLVFVNCHLDARNDTYRREQVRTLNAQLGRVMGHYAFDLTEQFHHVVWMGDMNYRIVHLDPQMVLHMLADGRNLELHDKFDGLLNDRRASGIFEGFTEPNKFADFYPTYKKLPKRGFVNEAQPAWPTLVYRVLYKEPFYKGGKVKKRVPGWCDRILVHSLLVSDSKLLPEKVESPFDHYEDEEENGGEVHTPQWIDNYRSVNHGEGMDVSDHSPVFATFVLSFPGLGGSRSSKDPSGGGSSKTKLRTRASRAQSTMLDGKHDTQQQQQMLQTQNSAFKPSGVTGSYFDQPKVVRHIHSVRPVTTVLIVSHMQLYWSNKALVPKKTRIVAPLVGEDLKQCDVIGERAMEIHAGSSSSNGAAGSDSTRFALSLNALIQHSRPLEQLHMLVWVKNDAIVGHCTLSLKRIARQDDGTDVRFRMPLYNNSMRLYHEGHALLLAFSVRSKTFAK